MGSRGLAFVPGDYLYATAEYYYDNTTLMPTVYTVLTYYEGEVSRTSSSYY